MLEKRVLPLQMGISELSFWSAAKIRFVLLSTDDLRRLSWLAFLSLKILCRLDARLVDYEGDS